MLFVLLEFVDNSAMRSPMIIQTATFVPLPHLKSTTYLQAGRTASKCPWRFPPWRSRWDIPPWSRGIFAWFHPRRSGPSGSALPASPGSSAAERADLRLQVLRGRKKRNERKYFINAQDWQPGFYLPGAEVSSRKKKKMNRIFCSVYTCLKLVSEPRERADTRALMAQSFNKRNGGKKFRTSRSLTSDGKTKKQLMPLVSIPAFPGLLQKVVKSSSP